MSALMGSRTNNKDTGGTAGYMSIGVPIRKICPACRKPKKAGERHPKCSRMLQGMNMRGEI